MQTVKTLSIVTLLVALCASQLMLIAVRLWTSAEQLGGREFCSLLNQALREA